LLPSFEDEPTDVVPVAVPLMQPETLADPKGFAEPPDDPHPDTLGLHQPPMRQPLKPPESRGPLLAVLGTLGLAGAAVLFVLLLAALAVMLVAVPVVSSPQPILMSVPLDGVSTVVLAGSGDLEIEVVDGPGSLLVDGGTAHRIEGGILTLDGHDDAVVQLPALTSVTVQGAGDLLVSGIEGERFVASVRGSGDLKLEGTVDDVELSVGGSGDLDAQDLVARTAAVKVNGSGSVELTATERLEAHILGSGDVTVAGEPADVVQQIRGSGRVYAD
jgi:hypothetical protein